MSEMNKNTASIFMIMFFVSCVVCRQIQIFDEIKEYNLQVVGIVSCWKISFSKIWNYINF